MTTDSGSTQPSSSSTGTRPLAGFASTSQSGRLARSIVTVSYGIDFSASTIRARVHSRATGRP
jgi:hypothetical protein